MSPDYEDSQRVDDLYGFDRVTKNNVYEKISYAASARDIQEKEKPDDSKEEEKDNDKCDEAVASAISEGGEQAHEQQKPRLDELCADEPPKKKKKHTHHTSKNIWLRFKKSYRMPRSWVARCPSGMCFHNVLCVLALSPMPSPYCTRTF